MFSSIAIPGMNNNIFRVLHDFASILALSLISPSLSQVPFIKRLDKNHSTAFRDICQELGEQMLKADLEILVVFLKKGNFPATTNGV